MNSAHKQHAWRFAKIHACGPEEALPGIALDALGVLWHPPFRTEVTTALRPGFNDHAGGRHMVRLIPF